ncbi:MULTISPECIES: PQQ-dependent sugar dehydrogenase [Methylosinus]|uniref:Sorbosone dehydrogenase n=1 Tax=Methylosinus trichosporium (strain ATCC 35070 / NCIMB 11131 / UNIQEM 75 / OB3b) TaxID=595536 RepID=A0A2D2CZN5_METT3|nr:MULTISPECIES: PQQ-dependent sugar dehydrogenase [Methylosinus]ATQ68089.1 sorbosone dehydrogenase [Methylosinus trichosporium OB3b]OBS54350.1 sorbosone dehydrogenase [Methylosinus sp. 3S-1]
MRIGISHWAVLLAIAGAGPAAAEPAPLLRGAAAFSDWRADAPGVRRQITAGDLPAPLASDPVASRSQIVARPADAAPRVPAGFATSVLATGLEGPRVIRVAPNGDVFVTESVGGRVRVLRLDGAAPAEHVFARDLERPSGLAFYPPGPDPQWLYVATVSQVRRYPYRAGDLEASGAGEIVVADLPRDGHWTRDIAFSPDGRTLYVAVGSRTNVAEGHAQPSAQQVAALERANGVGASDGPELFRADVLAFDPQGGQKRVFATGLRNCASLAFRPKSDELWCAVAERDMLGDDLPPDYVTHVREGGFYGWPWRYAGDNVDPRHAGERPDLAGRALSPQVLIQPHSAPLGVAFYEGDQFPRDYSGDAFVALHGSWNRAKRTGYKIVRLRFENGSATGEYEDFVTGFVADDAAVWGRPVAVAVARDGALLFGEDANGTIWRVSHP